MEALTWSYFRRISGMRLAVIGAGNVGGTLATAVKGHFFFSANVAISSTHWTGCITWRRNIKNGQGDHPATIR
jgi:hypothetical protein